ncbi:branched-chain amino acid ABC transporter permease [Bradyrhizobium sp. dw_411]|uniref:branched-chain amino acid ABC transporter permease n=1 Tax=Bradyrhizobium sp. dw_411 TaxID=2720082 RepID=UPI001BCC5DF6|nr:branched-chain amino acid ABC transporter permease [Bradyrhizobium sp. dw_411]
MTVLPYAINTLSTAVVYALFALAIVFAYRTSRILLFCVGEIGVMSAYVLSAVLHWTGTTAGGIVLAVAMTLLFDTVIGIVLFFVLGQEKQEDPFTGTAITIALAIFFAGCISVIWGGQVEQLPFPNGTISVAGASISIISVISIAVGAIVALAILALFYNTSIGIELQALANNRELAVLNGIPVNSRMLTVWIAASIVSGLAGVLSGAISSVSAGGTAVGFSGLVAAIIGGLTSPGGAIAGAMLLAAGENITSLFLDVRYSAVVPVGLLVALLALRPYGLSARVERIVRT